MTLDPRPAEPDAPAFDWRRLIPAWHVDAACRTVGTAVFFVAKGASTTPAKRICATCPVLAECLDEAVHHLEPEQAEHGIWGGMGEAQRRAARKAARSHASPRVQPGCSCAWCELVTAHVASLDGGLGAVGAVPEGATHGRRVTFARTCRCPACALAAVIPDHLTAMIPNKEPRP